MNLLEQLPESHLSGYKAYLVSITFIVIALSLRLLIWPIDAGLQYVTFFPAVAITAVFAGFWPGMVTALAGVLLATFIFTAPYMSVSLDVIKNSIWSNLVFSLDGLVVCVSIEAMHRFRNKYVKELKTSQAAHQHSEESRKRFMTILDNVQDGIITLDAADNIRSYNKAAAAIFRYPKNEVLNKPFSMLIAEDFLPKFYSEIQRYLLNSEQWTINTSCEIEGKRRDGSTFPLEFALSEIEDDEHLVCCVVRDISERKARERHMFHLAHHDQLTGLPNRILLLDRLHQMLNKAKRDHSKLSVMFIDLDDFKRINDTLGHDIGDLLLKAVTTSILDCLRESDTAARIGGDEFVILLPNANRPEDALTVAEKIRHVLCQPFLLRNERIVISSSIGVVHYPEHGSNEDILIQRADKAMYQAKHQGRNQVVLFVDEPEPTTP